MNTTAMRVSTSFCLNADLVAMLKEQAKQFNRSLDNYVEGLLFDIVYHEPNEETKAAIADAKADKNMTPVDMSSFDAFVKSCSE